MARIGGLFVLVCTLLGGSIAAGEEAKPDHVLPCPEPPSAFDTAKIDRTLAEPAYRSPKPLYRFFAFGPEGKHILAMVADESAPGKGYDTLYLDVNGNRDLTEAGERFALPQAKPAASFRGGANGWKTITVSSWGKTVMPETRLAVEDPMFNYSMSVGYSMVVVHAVTKAKDFAAPLRLLDERTPWSADRAAAPVFRFGGPEFHLRNEHFATVGKNKGAASAVGATLPIGTLLHVCGTAPYFAGTSDGIPFGAGGLYVAEGYRRLLRAWVESRVPSAKDFHVDLVFRDYCGSNNEATSLLTAFHPDGPAELVIALDTRSYQGVIEKRIPFTIRNPLYGKPVEPLPVTAELRRLNPDATVVELYQGVALPKYGVPSYDGVRDVYFGDGRGQNFGGSCTNKGTGLSYGRDMRFELHVGGEARRTFIQYDLSMLPAGTKVRKAVLMLHVRKVEKAGGVHCNVVALKTRWNEIDIGPIGGLNPTNAPTVLAKRKLYPVGTGEDWQLPLYRGEDDRHAEPVASIDFAKPGWVSADLTRAAANWASGMWANCGVAIEKPEADDSVRYGETDAILTSSDSPVEPALRPRLVLVLEGQGESARPAVQQRGDGFDAALAAARKAGRKLVINFLSAGSLTSRRFESGVLADAEAGKFLDARFVEIRLDAGRAENAGLLARLGVRCFPSTVIVWPDLPEGENFAIIEPFDWNAPFGAARSLFEFRQLYTRALEDLPANPEGGWQRSSSCSSAILMK